MNRILLCIILIPCVRLGRGTLRICLCLGVLKNFPLTLQYAKKAIRTGVTLSNEQARLNECELFAFCFETDDMQEGMNAFIEKRKPTFKGI